MPFDETTDDQHWWTLQYLAQSGQPKVRIALDTQCILFQNLYGAEDALEFKDGYWYNINTQTRPQIFHGNGSSKKMLFGTIGPAIGYETHHLVQK